MPEELLQRMRDIHYPDAPGWFPPAPGWWLLAALLLAGLVWVAWWWRQRQQLRAPYAQALLLLEGAQQRFSAGTLSPRDYLDYCNQILKRLLVHVRHNPAAVAASGSTWLAELDRLHGGNQFTRGPGQALGDARFAPTAPQIAQELPALLTVFVRRLRRNNENSTPVVADSGKLVGAGS